MATSRDRLEGRKRRDAVAVGDLVAPALRALGVPSRRLTQKIEDAWRRAADPDWGDTVRPLRLVGGVLVVSVASAALRQELALFHRERLLTVLRTALSDVTLVGLRFTAETAGALETNDG